MVDSVPLDGLKFTSIEFTPEDVPTFGTEPSAQLEDSDQLPSGDMNVCANAPAPNADIIHSAYSFFINLWSGVEVNSFFCNF